MSGSSSLAPWAAPRPDLYDLYRLVLEYDRTGGIGDALTTAPFDLGHLVADALRARVVEDSERAVRWLLDGGPEMSAVTAVDLRDVLGPLVDRLTGRASSPSVVRLRHVAEAEG